MKLTSLQVFNYLFYFIILFLPVNLGKHFVLTRSFIDGVLIDYWVPTLFLQDVLIVAFLLVALYLRKLKLTPFLAVLGSLLVLNTFFSINPLISLSYSVKVLLYGCFSYTVYKTRDSFNLSVVLKLLYASTIFINVLGIFQWFVQGSVANNYLFFGEQPYSVLTPQVLKQSFLNQLVVPSYSLFRHPNIFGGYLSVVLILFAYYLTGWRKHLILLLGSIALFLTFSYAAWLAFLFGLLYISLSARYFRYLLNCFVVLVFILGMFGFFDFSRIEQASVHRRFLLTQAAATTFITQPALGTGFGTNLFTSKDLSYMSRELNFFQPVHNIFWLLLSEAGFVIFTLFVLFFLYSLFSARLRSLALFAMLLQFVILGSFDHYLFTIHQTQLLFMLTIAFSFNYTLRHEI